MRKIVWVCLLFAAVGCQGQPPGRLFHLPPPPQWENRIEADRAHRDRFFRTGIDSPLPAAARASFEGLTYWGLDPDLYFVGEMQFYADGDPFEIQTTGGAMRPIEKVGLVEFEIDDRPVTLQVYRMLDQDPQVSGLFLPFMDGTTGEESYPAGRYVNLDGPVGGPYVLDFNRAYNPSCAYGEPERFACPRTPEENRLPVRIEAGERGYLHAP